MDAEKIQEPLGEYVLSAGEPDILQVLSPRLQKETSTL